MMKNYFSPEVIKLLKERIRELESFPPFKPEKDELRFTVTQLFEYIEVTLCFVIRDGEMIFYDSIKKMIR